MGRRRCGAINPPGGPSRTDPGARASRRWGPRWHICRRPVGRRRRTARPPTVESRWVMSRTDERTTTGDHAEQAFKHRARDALDLADLRFNGLQHASMLQGVEVRGSDRTLGVPRALGTSKARRKRTAHCGSPGADQRIRAMSHVWREAGKPAARVCQSPARMRATVSRSAAVSAACGGTGSPTA